MLCKNEKAIKNRSKKQSTGPTVGLILLTSTLVIASFPETVFSQTCVSNPIDIGYRDYFYRAGSVSGAPTEEKPQSKLWHNDGYWWGILWDPDLRTFRIHRLDQARQCWLSTGPNVDERPRSGADVLWDGSKLYIASSAKRNHRVEDGPELARIYRFSYDAANRTYSHDVGFPVLLNNTEKTRGIVIAKDSNGKLWVTWTADGKVMVNCSVGNDAIWNQPIVLPAQQNDLKIEDDDFTVDVSSIIAFGGSKIGIIWGNQNSDLDHVDRKYFFSVHNDTDPDSLWQAREDILPSLSATDPEEHVADDHLNLAGDPSTGVVIAAVKTGINDPGFPFVCVAKRDLNGVWTYGSYGTPEQAHTRPIVLYDTDVDSLYVFSKSDKEGKEAIYLKTAHIDNLVFPGGFGSICVSTEAPNIISNPTSTKQCVDGTSGIVFLASDRATEYYYHNYLVGGNAAPVAADDQVLTHENTATSFRVTDNDADSDGSIDSTTVTIATFPTNGTAVVDSSSGLISYSPAGDFAGSDTLKYSVRDNSGVSARAATVAIKVNRMPLALNDGGITQEETPVAINLVANDSDADGTLNVASISIESPPSNGTATVDTTTGALTYQPNLDFVGSDALTYTIEDNYGGRSNSATVIIAVSDVNDPPTAVNDTARTNQGTPVVIAVAANDLDNESPVDISSVAVVSAPGEGSVSVSPSSGEVTYTSNQSFFGIDTFTYTVDDPAGASSNPASVTVFVNALPQAAADSVVTHKDTDLLIDVTRNDRDPDGAIEASSVSVVSPPANGTAVIQPTGGITYTPGPGFVGSDSLSYTVDDNAAATSSPAAVYVKVNNPPVAVQDSVTAIQGRSIDIFAAANDTDTDGSIDLATLAVVSQPLNGTATADTASGLISYTPNPGFAGNDFFSYSVEDDDGAASNPAVITMRVNIPPNAVPDVVSGSEDSDLEINVTGNDVDIDGSLNLGTLTLVGQPGYGSATITAGTATIVYSPTSDFFGVDTLTYQVTDNEGAASNVANVILNITNVNDAPEAEDDGATTDEEISVAIAVLANDKDIDSALSPASVTIQSPPGNGTASVDTTTGAIDYLPGQDFTGVDSLAYQVSDAEGARSNVAKVTIGVGDVNDAPVANDDSVATPEESTVVVSVLSNDQDVDGNMDISSVAIVSPGANGTSSVNGSTGEISYTPDPDFVGSDSLGYVVRDDLGVSSNVGKVTISVTNVNDAPVAVRDVARTNEEFGVVIPVLANDHDIDSALDPTSLSIPAPPSHGAAIADTVGRISYTPDRDFVGSDSLTYLIADVEGAHSNPATIVISVANLNDPPVATADSVRTDKDVPISFSVVSNDYDVDGTVIPTSVVLLAHPGNGVATVDAATGEVTYSPPPGFVGQDSLTYTVADDNGAASIPGQVTLFVNDYPVANDDSATTTEEHIVEIAVLTNDLDVDSRLDSASVTIVIPSSHGISVVNPGAGTITYTPNPNHFGTDSLTYTVDDEHGARSNVATVTIIVNRPPIAVNDAASTNEDEPVSIGVIANDLDLDGSIAASTVLIIRQPNDGAATVDTVSGMITYTPSLDFAGSDAFFYQVRDNLGVVSNTATVTVSVNNAPVALADSALTHKDEPIDIDAKVNDTDFDGSIDPTSLAVSNSPGAGTAVVDTTRGVITYTPGTGFFGYDSLSYVISDLAGASSDPATVTIKVNNPPIVANDSAQTIRNFSVDVEVLANDADQDGALDSTTVVVAGAASSGVTSVDLQDGVITYTPDPDFSGTDTFSYTVEDNDGGVSALAVVSVQIAPNGDPVAVDDSASTNEEASIAINVLANDYDQDPDGSIDVSSVAVVAQPANGSAAVDRTTGVVTYTPGLDFFGTDVFTYTVNDNIGAPSNTAHVSVIVTDINDPPVAVNDTTATNEGTAVTIAVVSNDVDSDGTPVAASVAIVLPPGQGTASLGPASGEITYSPNRGFAGEDSFTYTVDDEDGETSAPGMVIVFVNDSPIAVNDTAATAEEQAVAINVTTNDEDSDGTVQPATVNISSSPENGSAQVDSSTGEITYTPSLDFVGTDSLTYTVQDDDAATSNVAVVWIIVSNVNDAPVAVNDTLVTDEEVAVGIDVFSNDTDADGGPDSTSVVLVDSSNSGTLSVNGSTGLITYSPNLNFFGVDRFRYAFADDAGASSNEATVVITVSNVNDPPVAANDTALTNMNTQVDIDVATNDSDVDGRLDLTTLSVSSASNGTTSLKPSGEVTYTPILGFVGQDSFSYTIDDDSGAGSNSALVIVRVNAPPVALDDSTETLEVQPVTVAVLANDTDSDGQLVAATLTITSLAEHGTSSVDTANGQLTYVPSPGFVGQDTLGYMVMDNDGATSGEAAVVVTILRDNKLPVAVDDTTETHEDVPVTIAAAANDYDPDRSLDLSSLAVVTGPSNGSASVSGSSGEIVYLPAPEFSGTDLLGYTITDNEAAISNEASILITVIPVNDPPVAVDDTTDVLEDAQVAVTVLANDSDVDGVLEPSSLTIVAGAANGSTSIDQATGAVTYIPNHNFVGQDSFTYRANDDSGLPSNLATAVINVIGNNQPPDLGDDEVTTEEDSPTSIIVTANDRDSDGTLDLGSLSIVSHPGNGSASVSGSTGAINYTPNSDFAGADSLTYTIRDDNGDLSNVATVVVTVSEVNDPPVATDDQAATAENAAVLISVLANDSDVDGPLDPAAVVIVRQPAIGIVSVDPTTGTVTYSPNAGLVGDDAFSYIVSDDQGVSSNEATVSVTVNGDNDAPVAIDDAAVTPENSPVVVELLANDGDIDGIIDPGSVTIVSGPTNGSATVVPATGHVLYSPASNFSGADTFRYTVVDNGGLLSNAATVTLTVHPSRLTFTPVHDTHVRSDNPSNSYGTAGDLRLRQSSGSWLSFLKFDVSGAVAAVESAKLRLFVLDGSDDGGAIFKVSNNYVGTGLPWTEIFLVYNNAPIDLNTPLSTTGAVNPGEFVEFDVTAAISGNGIFSLGIKNESGNAVKFSSKEGSNPPELIIQLMASNVTAPDIAAFAPTSGQIGQEVTVSGTHLSLVTNVSFGGTVASNFTVDSDAQLRVIVPAGAATGKITIVSPVGIDASADDFTLAVAPTITSFSPASGPVGTEVTIIGRDYAQIAQVSFGGTLATDLTVDSGTQLRAVVPPGAASGKITVANSFGTAASPADFSVLNTPLISSFDPTSGVAGDEVTVMGLNFIGVNDIAFNGVTASDFFVHSDSQIRVTVPAGAGTGQVSVTNSDGTSSSLEIFAIVQPPAITGFAPASGSVGTAVTLTGRGFATVTEVRFNGALASTFSAETDSRILAIVPSLASSGALSVTNSAGVASSSGNYTVTAPTGNLTFDATDDAFVRSSKANSNYGSDDELRVKLASTEYCTYVKFTVTGATGQVSRAVIRLQVRDGSVDGGAIYLVSNNYANGASPWHEAGLTWNNAPQVSATPLSSIGTVGTGQTVEFDVTSAVQGDGVYSFVIRSSSPDVAKYESKEGAFGPELALEIGGAPPQQAGLSITSLAPTSGAVGTEVTVGGTGLGGVTGLAFNSTPADFSVTSSSEIRTTVPPGASTGPVTVSNGTATAASGSAFEVTASTSPSVQTFQPTDDAYVRSSSPTRNYGTANTLRARQTGATICAFLKFNVSGLDGAPISAKIRLFVIDGSDDAGTIHLVSNDYQGIAAAWSEGGLTFANAPQVTNPPLDSGGPIGADQTIEFDVTSAIHGEGTYSFAVINSSSDLVKYYSKEGPVVPELVLAAGSGSEPPSPPSISSFEPLGGEIGTEVTIFGSHLGGVSTVSFNGSAATNATVDSDGQIRTSVPNGAASGRLTVAGGAGSATSAVDFTVVTGSGGSLTFLPSDDAFVRSTRPDAGYEHSAELRVRRSSSDYDSYLKFAVSGISGPVQSAKVRLRVIDPSGEGGSIHLVSNDFKTTPVPWTEAALTFNNAPAITGAALSSVGAVSLGETVEFDVTAAITGNGVFSFAITNETSDAAKYSSKDGVAAPELVITTFGGAPTPAPSISSFSPAVGPVGTEVTINGAAFQAISAVSFADTAAAGFTVDSETRIRASVPNGASTGVIRVSNVAGVGASSNDFVVFSPPVITGFSPGSGAAGTQVTISGTGFAGVTSVRFNGAPATDFTFVTENSETKVRATVPGSATTGKISLVNAAGSGASPVDFIVGTFPAITSFAPAFGVVGTEVTIMGTSFAGVSHVSFNGVAASGFVVVSDTELRADVPSQTGSGPIVLTSSSGTGTSNEDFVVVAVPTIDSFTPTSGAAGAEVTLAGSGFTGATNVSFNGSQAVSFTVDSGNELRASVPTSATSGVISVTNNAGTATSSQSFAVTQSEGGGAHSFLATDDTYVRSSRPTERNGSDAELKVRKTSADRRAYLKFVVTGLTTPVQSALLRLNVLNGSEDGGSLYSVSNNFSDSLAAWDEDDLTWENAPNLAGTPLAELSNVNAGEIIEVDVTAAVVGNGTYSFGVRNNSRDIAIFSSKEGVSAPELLINAGLSKQASETEDFAEEETLTASDPPLPEEIMLYPNYPNPFNAGTTVSFALPRDARVKVGIYNLRGQLVRLLVDANQKAGFKKVRWDGRNQRGHEAGSGVYFLRLAVGEAKLSRKITIQR